ncbi:MAG: TraX family protein [Eubacteriales bacterium]|nr:TraX family protein [Eubacteriales bacterium]
MPETRPKSIFPQRWQIFSGSALKVIAMVIMLVDHGAAFLLRYVPQTMTPLFYIGGNPYSLYRIMRDTGRCAFPIFCFLLTEGFLHTHSRVKYGRNLLLFACISEIPWNLAQNGTLFYPDKQNVFFTLFLGYLAFCAMEYFSERPVLSLLSIILLYAAAWHLGADYSYRGYVFLLIMYTLRDQRPAQAVVGTSWLLYEWKACTAFLSINLYNGKRGFIRGKWAKYFFYAFYPLHILVLYGLRRLLIGA